MLSNIEALARGTTPQAGFPPALSRAVERPRKRGSPRRNSGFSQSFRMFKYQRTLKSPAGPWYTELVP